MEDVFLEINLIISLFYTFFSVSKVFRRIQTSSPVLSHDEREWTQELKRMQTDVNKLKKFSEVVSSIIMFLLFFPVTEILSPKKTLP